MDLHKEKQHGTLAELASKEEETVEDVLSSIDIIEICKIWETMQSFVKKDITSTKKFWANHDPFKTICGETLGKPGRHRQNQVPLCKF